MPDDKNKKWSLVKKIALALAVLIPLAAIGAFFLSKNKTTAPPRQEQKNVTESQTTTGPTLVGTFSSETEKSKKLLETFESRLGILKEAAIKNNSFVEEYQVQEAEKAFGQLKESSDRLAGLRPFTGAKFVDEKDEEASAALEQTKAAKENFYGAVKNLNTFQGETEAGGIVDAARTVSQASALDKFSGEELLRRLKTEVESLGPEVRNGEAEKIVELKQAISDYAGAFGKTRELSETGEGSNSPEVAGAVQKLFQDRQTLSRVAENFGFERASVEQIVKKTTEEAGLEKLAPQLGEGEKFKLDRQSLGDVPEETLASVERQAQAYQGSLKDFLGSDTYRRMLNGTYNGRSEGENPITNVMLARGNLEKAAETAGISPEQTKKITQEVEGLYKEPLSLVTENGRTMAQARFISDTPTDSPPAEAIKGDSASQPQQSDVKSIDEQIIERATRTTNSIKEGVASDLPESNRYVMEEIRKEIDDNSNRIKENGDRLDSIFRNDESLKNLFEQSVIEKDISQKKVSELDGEIARDESLYKAFNDLKNNAPDPNKVELNFADDFLPGLENMRGERSYHEGVISENNQKIEELAQRIGLDEASRKEAIQAIRDNYNLGKEDDKLSRQYNGFANENFILENYPRYLNRIEENKKEIAALPKEDSRIEQLTKENASLNESIRQLRELDKTIAWDERERVISEAQQRIADSQSKVRDNLSKIQNADTNDPEKDSKINDLKRENENLGIEIAKASVQDREERIKWNERLIEEKRDLIKSLSDEDPTKAQIKEEINRLEETNNSFREEISNMRRLPGGLFTEVVSESNGEIKDSEGRTIVEYDPDKGFYNAETGEKIDLSRLHASSEEIMSDAAQTTSGVEEQNNSENEKGFFETAQDWLGEKAEGLWDSWTEGYIRPEDSATMDEPRGMSSSPDGKVTEDWGLTPQEKFSQQLREKSSDYRKYEDGMLEEQAKALNSFANLYPERFDELYDKVREPKGGPTSIPEDTPTDTSPKPIVDPVDKALRSIGSEDDYFSEVQKKAFELSSKGYGNLSKDEQILVDSARKVAENGELATREELKQEDLSPGLKASYERNLAGWNRLNFEHAISDPEAFQKWAERAEYSPAPDTFAPPARKIPSQNDIDAASENYEKAKAEYAEGKISKDELDEAAEKLVIERALYRGYLKYETPKTPELVELEKEAMQAYKDSSKAFDELYPEKAKEIENRLKEGEGSNETPAGDADRISPKTMLNPPPPREINSTEEVFEILGGADGRIKDMFKASQELKKNYESLDEKQLKFVQDMESLVSKGVAGTEEELKQRWATETGESYSKKRVLEELTAWKQLESNQMASTKEIENRYENKQLSEEELPEGFDLPDKKSLSPVQERDPRSFLERNLPLGWGGITVEEKRQETDSLIGKALKGEDVRSNWEKLTGKTGIEKYEELLGEAGILKKYNEADNFYRNQESLPSLNQLMTEGSPMFQYDKRRSEVEEDFSKLYPERYDELKKELEEFNNTSHLQPEKVESADDALGFLNPMTRGIVEETWKLAQNYNDLTTEQKRFVDGTRDLVDAGHRWIQDDLSKGNFSRNDPSDKALLDAWDRLQERTNVGAPTSEAMRSWAEVPGGDRAAEDTGERLASAQATAGEGGDRAENLGNVDWGSYQWDEGRRPEEYQGSLDSGWVGESDYSKISSENQALVDKITGLGDQLYGERENYNELFKSQYGENYFDKKALAVQELGWGIAAEKAYDPDQNRWLSSDEQEGARRHYEFLKGHNSDVKDWLAESAAKQEKLEEEIKQYREQLLLSDVNDPQALINEKRALDNLRDPNSIEIPGEGKQWYAWGLDELKKGDSGLEGNIARMYNEYVKPLLPEEPAIQVAEKQELPPDFEIPPTGEKERTRYAEIESGIRTDAPPAAPDKAGAYPGWEGELSRGTNDAGDATGERASSFGDRTEDFEDYWKKNQFSEKYPWDEMPTYNNYEGEFDRSQKDYPDLPPVSDNQPTPTTTYEDVGLGKTFDWKRMSDPGNSDEPPNGTRGKPYRLSDEALNAITELDKETGNVTIKDNFREILNDEFGEPGDSYFKLDKETNDRVTGIKEKNGEIDPKKAKELKSKKDRKTSLPEGVGTVGKDGKSETTGEGGKDLKSGNDYKDTTISTNRNPQEPKEE